MQSPIEPLPLVLSSIAGYLLGSLPSAYLLVRWKSSVDIRAAGSGNVGTLNSLQVTGSRTVGLVVLVVDVMKGILAVVLAGALFGPQFQCLACAGLFSVVGHNYPVWLGFKGGRGLATAAGVLIPLSPLVIAAWGSVWASAFLAIRNVNVSNAIATATLIVLVWIFPDSIVMQVAADFEIMWFRAFLTGLFFVILTGHVTPVREFLKRKNNPEEGN